MSDNIEEFDPYATDSLNPNAEDEAETFIESEEEFDADDISFEDEDFELHEPKKRDLAFLKSGTMREQRAIDENKPRYGIAVLKPIAMQDSSAQFYLGDFHEKNPSIGGKRPTNALNLAFFPALTVFPFTTGPVPVPHEGNAQYLTEDQAEEETAEEFSLSTLENTLKSARKTVTRTALKFANQVFDRYKEEGFTVLKSLEGIESYIEAQRLVDIVITPEAVIEKFGSETRERLGYELSGPFINEIISFLQRHSGNRIKQFARSMREVELLKQLRREILQACLIARSWCEKTLSESEGLIRAKLKTDYDMPDLERTHAKPPRDLFCMIHLNRYPADMTALKIASAVGESIQRTTPEPVQSVGGITPDALEMILNRVTQNQDQRIAELMEAKKATSPGGEAGDSTGTTEKGGRAKNK